MDAGQSLLMVNQHGWSDPVTPPSRRPAYSRRYDKLRRNGIYMTVDGTVTRRKLAALQALGYTLTHIGALMGRHQQAVSELFYRAGPVHRSSEREVAAIYDRLHMTPASGPYAHRARLRAQRRGYPSPLAWNDINDLREGAKGVRAA
jgi:hypothetical protein